MNKLTLFVFSFIIVSNIPIALWASSSSSSAGALSRAKTAAQTIEHTSNVPSMSASAAALSSAHRAASSSSSSSSSAAAAAVGLRNDLKTRLELLDKEELENRKTFEKLDAQEKAEIAAIKAKYAPSRDAILEKHNQIKTQQAELIKQIESEPSAAKSFVNEMVQKRAVEIKQVKADIEIATAAFNKANKALEEITPTYSSLENTFLYNQRNMHPTPSNPLVKVTATNKFNSSPIKISFDQATGKVKEASDRVKIAQEKLDNLEKGYNIRITFSDGKVHPQRFQPEATVQDVIDLTKEQIDRRSIRNVIGYKGIKYRDPQMTLLEILGDDFYKDPKIFALFVPTETNNSTSNH